MASDTRAAKKASAKKAAAKSAGARSPDPDPSGGSLDDRQLPPDRNGNGAGTARVSDAVKQHFEHWWVDQFANPEILTILARSAAFVFLLAAISVLAIGLVGLFVGNDPYEGFVVLRTLELMLKVVGAAAIILLVFNTPNGFAKAFGFVVIAGLIMGPTDLIRLTLVLTNSERKLEEFLIQVEQPETGQQLRHDAQTVIKNELSIIESELGKDGLNLSRFKRAQLEQKLQEYFIAFVEDRLWRRVEQANATHTLEEFGHGRGPGLIYKHKDSVQFVQQLNRLRSDGLIQFILTDFDTARITDLGCRILVRKTRANGNQNAPGFEECPSVMTTATTEATAPNPDRPAAGTPSPDYPPATATAPSQSTAQSVGDDEQGSMMLGQLDLEGDLVSGPPMKAVVDSGGDYRIYEFTLPGLDESTELFLQAISKAGDDPEIILFEAPNWPGGEFVPVSIFYDLTEIAFGDDELNLFDAEISWFHHDSKTYWLILRNIDGRPTPIDITLTRESKVVDPE